jgi:hypothetical protein
VDTTIVREKPPDVFPREATPESWHGCYEGWVYLGFEGEDDNGEHVEEIERVPCRKCHPTPLTGGSRKWQPYRKEVITLTEQTAKRTPGTCRYPGCERPSRPNEIGACALHIAEWGCPL